VQDRVPKHLSWKKTQTVFLKIGRHEKGFGGHGKGSCSDKVRTMFKSGGVRPES